MIYTESCIMNLQFTVFNIFAVLSAKRAERNIMYTVETVCHGKVIETNKYRNFEVARKRVTQLEKVAHKTHSLLNVVLFENEVKLLERFFG